MMQQWQRRAALSAGVILASELAARAYTYDRTRATIGVIPASTDRPLASRVAACHIRNCAASRHHLLVCGPTGVGKTMAVKVALDSQEPIDDSPPTKTTFLPFYVDLKPLIAPASHQEDSRLEVGPGASVAPLRDLAACVDAAFSAAADAFEERSIVTLRELAWCRLFFELSRAGYLGRAVAAAWAQQQKLPAPSIQRHLERFLDDSAVHSLSLFAISRFQPVPLGCIPVIIVDEMHLLNHPELKTIRHEFVAFLLKHASAKIMSPVIIVLLSSDATAPKILASWGGGFDLTKLFHNEVIGDLQQTELGDFASRLLEGKKSEVHPGLQRCRDIMADAERFGKAYHCYGGFVRDWIRLLDAQLEERGFDILLEDESKVNALINLSNGSVSFQLRRMGIDPADVLQTFRAIIQSTTSPRGAVLQDVLLRSCNGRFMPPDALHRMAKNNLIEERSGNPAMLDYSELLPLSNTDYVCAPSPLARVSMAEVVKKLEAEERKKEAEERKVGALW